MIKQETLNAIINYLVHKPYQEVISIITMIQNDMQQQQPKNETEVTVDEVKE